MKRHRGGWVQKENTGTGGRGEEWRGRKALYVRGRAEECGDLRTGTAQLMSGDRVEGLDGTGPRWARLAPSQTHLLLWLALCWPSRGGNALKPAKLQQANRKSLWSPTIPAHKYTHTEELAKIRCTEFKMRRTKREWTRKERKLNAKDDFIKSAQWIKFNSTLFDI